MSQRRMITVDGNEATASVAHRLSEVRRRFDVTRKRQLVLMRALYAPSFRHGLRAFAHRQAGARLLNTRKYRLEVFRPKLC